MSYGDSNTYTMTIEPHHAYLWINTHIYNREIILLTTYNDILHTDVILYTGTKPTTFSLSNLVLTFTTGNCRGRIIDLHTLSA